jgi:hypothetical protein
MFKSLKKAVAPSPTELGGRLRTRHAKAGEALEAARQAFRAAVLEHEITESADAAKRKDQAARDVAAAEARVAELAAAIEAAGDRDAAQAQKSAEVEHRRRWDAAMSHVGPRLKAADDVMAAVATLAEAFGRLAEHSGAMVLGAPIVVDADGALLKGPDLIAALRIELVRNGFVWAATYPWPVTDIPPLPDRIAAGNTHLENQRKADR